MNTARPFAAGLMTLLVLQALAQPAASPPPAPVKVSGTIVRLEGQTLTVKTAEGSGDITLPPDVRISNNRKASLKEISANTFVGTTAVQGSDGKLHATEVHIFPESMRGSGEGHRPWFGADTTMTNGSVATMTNGSAQQKEGADGDVVLKVTYKDGEKDVHVAPDVPVTMVEAGDRTTLQPGEKVTVLVRENPDGSAVALIISVGAYF